MQATFGGLKTTYISEGLGGNSINSTHLIRTYGADKVDHASVNATGMAEIFTATDIYNDKAIIGMTEAKGKKIYLKSEQYSWRLRGYMKQKARVTELIETSTRPGENKSQLVACLDKPWYKEPDVLTGEDERYPLEVIGEAEPRGANSWKYTFEIQTDSNATYLPLALLAVGQEFTKNSTSIVSEDNNKYGTQQLNSVFQVRSQLGMFAQKIEITDRALRIDKNYSTDGVMSHWNVPFMDNKGKAYSNFMPMWEAEMRNELYEGIEWAMIFGKQSTKVGYNSYTKRTGPGLREQLERGNNLFHNNNLTLTRLDQWLNSIFRGRRDAKNRKVVLMTGEMGAEMFHNMVMTEASSFLTVDSNFITVEERSGSFNHLAFGAQYTHYRGINGLDVTVMLNPAYDNPDWSKRKHPIYTDTVLDSWRMDILDFGAVSTYDDTSNNIMMVSEQYADVFFTTSGKWDARSGMPINDGGPGLAGGVSGYGSYIEKSAGLLIKDITRCGTIQLRIS